VTTDVYSFIHRPQIRGLIFDMDGTLIDSMYAWRDGKLEVLESLGCQLTDAEKHRIRTEWCSIYKFDIVQRLFPTEEGMALVKKTFYDYAANYYLTRATVKPGLVEFLTQARAEGYKLAVATSTAMNLVEPTLKHLGLWDLFDFVGSTYDIGVGKETPAIYDHAANMLGLGRESTVVFEDAVFCIRTCSAAGLNLVAVEDKYAAENKEEILSLCDAYLESYEQLLK